MTDEARAFLERRASGPVDVAELAELVELFKKWWRDGHAFACRPLELEEPPE